jgi:hypothetical protein
MARFTAVAAVLGSACLALASIPPNGVPDIVTFEGGQTLGVQIPTGNLRVSFKQVKPLQASRFTPELVAVLAWGAICCYNRRLQPVDASTTSGPMEFHIGLHRMGDWLLLHGPQPRHRTSPFMYHAQLCRSQTLMLSGMCSQRI